MTDFAKKQTGLTHVQFAAQDTHFKACCTKANVPATKRQAMKFRNRRGQAYREHLLVAKGNKGVENAAG